MNLSIEELVNSQRYKNTVKELGTCIDECVGVFSLNEPTISTMVDPKNVEVLLNKEKQKNEQLWNKIVDQYHEILEDTLLAEFEMSPLEQKRNDLWKTLSKSHYAKLIEKYEVLEREEAANVVRIRNICNKPIEYMPLQKAVYETETSNKKLQKEIKVLELQYRRTIEDLEKENSIEPPVIQENNDLLLRARSAKEQLEKMEKQIGNYSKMKENLQMECDEIANEIDKITERLVSYDKRSIANRKGRNK